MRDLIRRVTKPDHDPDDLRETGAERSARHDRRREARARLAEAEKLRAEKAILDERVRMLDSLWQAAIEEHDQAVKPLQAELGELEAAAVERIRQRKPSDPKAESRRVELMREIADANATLEAQKPEPMGSIVGVGPNFGGAERVARSERDKLHAKAASLQGEIARLEARGKLTKPGVGDPLAAAESVALGRFQRLLANVRVEAEKIAEYRPHDLDRYSEDAVRQYRRSKREASAAITLAGKIIGELLARQDELHEQMERESE